jgi:hypothetical protein
MVYCSRRFNYFFPFLLADPFCCFVGVDDGVAGWGAEAGAGADLTAASGAILGGEGLCKKLMKKVATPPLNIYMSHLGTRTRAP